MTKQEFDLKYRDNKDIHCDTDGVDSYVVSILDGQNNPSDNLDNFSGLNEAIDYAKEHHGTGVFQERYRKDKESCEYLLVWHPNAEEVE